MTLCLILLLIRLLENNIVSLFYQPLLDTKYDLFNVSESQRGCIDIEVCDHGLIDWRARINVATSFLWCHLSGPPPTVDPFIRHTPLIQSIFSPSSVYFRMTAAELLFFLQTLRGLEQCLLFDPWPVIHSHHVKSSHMGRIKLQ